MHRILLAVDGSEHSDRAVRYLIGLIRDGGLLGGSTEIQIFHVRPHLSERISRSMSAQALDRHYQEGSDMACRSAMETLHAEGVAFVRHTRIGAGAEMIVAGVRELQCDSILMGTHGAGFVTGVLLGSVATKVIHLTVVPVTLVK